MSLEVLEADLTWQEGGFAAGQRITITPEGRIAAVGASATAPTRRLRGMALLPGFVNTHSHAFQRGLRGAGERFPAGSGSFWTWRQAMYDLVAGLDRTTLAALCRQAFGEMRDAGITTVGEFHYLHHENDLDFAFDRVVLDAAAAIGIRLVLLNACYLTGGVGRPIEPAQRRFATPSLPAFWERMDRLSEALDARTQTLGVVAHSLRAVGPVEIRDLHAEACRRGWPFHMHVEEQRREIEESIAAYGRTPMAVILQALATHGSFTAVHCTHTAARDMAAFLETGGSVCVCPLTEANLGDGIPALGAAHDLPGRLSLGTDSNARISMIEEMRWLEYGQRLRGELRGALADDRGDVAATLLHAATAGGAVALKVEAGRMSPGAWADFVALDLSAPALAQVPPDRLLDAVIFGSGNEAVAGTFVGGRWRATGNPER